LFSFFLKIKKIKTHVNKSAKKIKSILYFICALFINGTFSSITPVSFGFKKFLTTPLLSIKALNPLLADLSKKLLLSIDLKIAFAKC
jgi:hypothetical protein